jgi:hypothetical protein
MLLAKEERNDKFHHIFMINLSDIIKTKKNDDNLELNKTLAKVTNCEETEESEINSADDVLNSEHKFNLREEAVIKEIIRMKERN